MYEYERKWDTASYKKIQFSGSLYNLDDDWSYST